MRTLSRKYFLVTGSSPGDEGVNEKVTEYSQCVVVACLVR